MIASLKHITTASTFLMCVWSLWAETKMKYLQFANNPKPRVASRFFMHINNVDDNDSRCVLLLLLLLFFRLLSQTILELENKDSVDSLHIALKAFTVIINGTIACTMYNQTNLVFTLSTDTYGSINGVDAFASVSFFFLFSFHPAVSNQKALNRCLSFSFGIFVVNDFR